MAKKNTRRTFDGVLAWLREHGFEVSTSTSGAAVQKYGCAASLENGTQGPGVNGRAGYIIGGEVSRLLDRGFQKFLRTSKLEVPATADHLKALHQFSEELREALGATSLYNEALGTVSDRYVYDRTALRKTI
jgi:hypothetical protein